jgi:phytol kinase
VTHHLPDFVIVLIFAGIYLFVFVLGEVIRRLVPSKPEIPRKAVHFASGLIALSIPCFLKSHWWLLSLVASFTVILALAQKKHWFESIFGVERKSHGAILFPVTVYVLFVLSTGNYILYFIPILIMTVSDTLAAVIGGRYGSIKFDVEGNKKSLEGSTTFFLIAFLCVHLSLLLMTDTSRIDSVMIAFVIALLVTGFEAVSSTGLDNFYVPLGTYYLLVKIMGSPFVVRVEHVTVLVLMAIMTTILSLKSKLLRTSGLIGMLLLNYAAWSLGDWSWLLPLLVAQVLLYALTLYFSEKVLADITGYQISVLFYSAVLPVTLLFALNTLGRHDVLYLPYLTSAIGQVLAMFYYFIINLAERNAPFTRWLKLHSLLASTIYCMILTLVVATVPVTLFYSGNIYLALLAVGSGSWMAMYLFSLFYDRLQLKDRRVLRQKVRLWCVAAAVVWVFAFQFVLRLPGKVL